MNRTALVSVGFWKDTRVVLDLSGHPHPQDFVDPTWDASERKAVAEYLEAGRAHESYLGYSYCRFEYCGRPDQDMGTKDLTDGVYVWPEGYSHYVRVHNVKPPDDFVQHVLSAVNRDFVRYVTIQVWAGEAVFCPVCKVRWTMDAVLKNRPRIGNVDPRILVCAGCWDGWLKVCRFNTEQVTEPR